MERVNVFFNADSLAKHIRPVRPGRVKMSAAARARTGAAKRRRRARAQKVGTIHEQKEGLQSSF
jgi:hypothetical protein